MPEESSTEQPATTRKLLHELWQRLKPHWLLRGSVLAFAIVGVLDQIGLSRSFLRVIHALGVLWNGFMTWITGLVTSLLPFGLQLNAEEGNALTIMNLLVLPAAISVLNAVIFLERKIPIFCGFAAFASVLVAQLMLFTPDASYGPYLLWGAALIFVPPVVGMMAINIRWWMISFQHHGRFRIPIKERILFVGCGVGLLAGVTALVVLTITGALPAEMVAPMTSQTVSVRWEDYYSALWFLAGVVWALALAHPKYFKMMFVIAALLLTLEALYHVPLIEQWLAPYLDQLDPAGAGGQSTDTAAVTGG